jgi:hypothetical protein
MSTVARNVPLRRDPERFHVEKSCIYQDLEYVAGLIEEQSKPQITVSRQRRDAMVTVISGKRVTVNTSVIRSSPVRGRGF